MGHQDWGTIEIACMGENGRTKRRDLCRFWQGIAPGAIAGTSSISGYIGTPWICGMHV